jgi:hypothetical protein
MPHRTRARAITASRRSRFCRPLARTRPSQPCPVPTQRAVRCMGKNPQLSTGFLFSVTPPSCRLTSVPRPLQLDLPHNHICAIAPAPKGRPNVAPGRALLAPGYTDNTSPPRTRNLLHRDQPRRSVVAPGEALRARGVCGKKNRAGSREVAPSSGLRCSGRATSREPTQTSFAHPNMARFTRPTLFRLSPSLSHSCDKTPQTHSPGAPHNAVFVVWGEIPDSRQIPLQRNASILPSYVCSTSTPTRSPTQSHLCHRPSPKGDAS